MAWAEDDVSSPKRRGGSAIDKYIIKSLRINLNVHQKLKTLTGNKKIQLIWRSREMIEF